MATSVAQTNCPARFKGGREAIRGTQRPPVVMLDTKPTDIQKSTAGAAAKLNS